MTGQGSAQRSMLLKSATGKQGDDGTVSASTPPRSRLKRGAVKHGEAEDESAQAFRAPRKKIMAFTIAQICMQPSERSSEAVSVSEDDEYQDSYEEADDDDDRGLPLQLAQEEASAELGDLSDADSVTKMQPHTTQDDTISGTKSDSCVPDKPRLRTKPCKLVPDPVVKAVEQAPDADEVAHDGGLFDEDTAIATLESSRGRFVEEDGAFMKGFDQVHDSWEGFFLALKKHCDGTWQLLPKRTSYSADLRNKKMKERGVPDGDPRLLPSTFPHYSLTLMCFHGIDHPKKGKGKRQRRIIRYLACGAKVNALSRCGHDGEWKGKAWIYATSTTCSRLGRVKIKEGADEERTVSLLREFCETDRNAATLSVGDSSGLEHAVCFQTARQKRLFTAFPEVILVDTTHDTNKIKYKLFSIQVDDVFGKGQYVYHSLVESEMADNLSFCLKEFKESNTAWVNIRVVVTDKDFNEKDVLADAFPDARQLLCQFHVID
ncbi:hypothetical protein PF010_g18098 [Phytophthora fragariae]|uniref:ZSWIM1/3 RNaseH-like domain-containing protein n=1 Tax=Phytophthora fragariae TaxID=53985 RepID=A0A6G0KM48_9STRA|nr:hypothetical protein PF010_g18098 [Phytophthora fragariae]